MRLVSAVQILVLLLLALALFGGEVGESACFVDDISNDYIETPAPPVQRFAKIAPAHAIFRGSINLTGEFFLNIAVIPSTGLSRSSASDLLRLLSIQRK